MAKKLKTGLPELESARNMVEPITPPRKRKKRMRASEQADQEYLERLAQPYDMDRDG